MGVIEETWGGFVSADSVKAAICAEEARSTAEAQLGRVSQMCVSGVWREPEFSISIWMNI